MGKPRNGDVFTLMKYYCVEVALNTLSENVKMNTETIVSDSIADKMCQTIGLYVCPMSARRSLKWH